MRRRLTSLGLLAFLGLGTVAFAQVTGVVNDGNNFPESDVEVTVKGTDKVAYTDENGNFNIDAKVGDTLIINGKEFKVTSTNLGALKYAEDADLKEVVVLGYGLTSTKPKSMAASTTVSSEVLANRPNATFLNSLQGSAPGISINSASGSPGSGKINVRIRGLSSLNASTDPLYVIDGLISSGSQFRNLNANDIETVSVLRDAQGTAIYGNRGANGVVVITTKTGRYNSGLAVNYDALTSFSLIPKTDYNLASAKELLTIHKMIGLGAGASMTDEQIANYTTNTNWEKEFLKIAAAQQHNVGLKFGGENVTVYSSAGYLEAAGNVKSTDFKRFTFRNNINGKSSNGRFTYTSQLALGYSKRNQLDQETNTGVNNNVVQNPLFGTLLSPASLAPYRFADGRDMYNQIGSNTSGRSAWILYDIINGGVKNRFTETSILANVSGNYKLTDWLSVGNKTGIDYKYNQRVFARTPNGYLSVNVAASQGAQYGGFEDFTNTNDFTFSSVSNITFDKQFGDHSLTIAGYLDYLKAHYQTSYQRVNGLDPLTYSFGSGKGYVPFNPATPNIYQRIVTADKLNAGTLAYFGTLDYDYAGKYGLSGVVRRDGSYRFYKANRWETFWSVAGRWNIDQEEFLRGSSVRMLKLRASYGTTGNQNLIRTVDNLNPLFGGANLYKTLNTTTTGYMNLPGYTLLQIENNDLKWEKSIQANIGLDFSIFNGLVDGTIDVYDKRTERMFDFIALSATNGVPTLRGNNGEMSNRGIEAGLKFNIVNKDDFKFDVFANYAYNKNRIESLGTEDLSGDVVNAVGDIAYQWHLYKYVGVNPKTGEQQFLDKDGNITEAPTSADRQLTGKSYYAPVQGGFGFNIDYKGFYAATLFSFQTGGWSYDNFYSWLMDPSTAAAYNGSADILKGWSTTNPNSNIPAVTATNIGLEGSSDRFLYKTDFLRLKNVSVGYNFTKKQLQSLPVKNMRVFVSAENIVTWTDWKGYDPEPIQSYSLGVYPNPRSISLGFNVEF
ncbi:SusC/RagA family TonB-linked outer membrane protein [Empedobacter sp. GD03797]|uniref:SusC/RagA family TonB-linked outer membrane protein n=1 Tax=Empedobacter sp. GD03797 TaxID=2975382 RepID=UPI0024476B46|nr:SusC/RagA family TonB-linked outer membrane protein [Empedobacter sp. GD03797]MDH1882874.1 SusC/RagA family TonB-linked outer membrane protein [Empedobacter sp. GD03797]